MKIKNLSLKDLAIFLSDYLSKRGIETVLSGGACVSIYTKNKYLSYDLDFVLLSYIERKKITSVGEEPVGKITEIKKGNRVLKLLSPTDCVKDRLAAFYFWNDKQSLEQAILVSLDNDIDRGEINRWSLKEGMQDKLETFTNVLKKRKV